MSITMLEMKDLIMVIIMVDIADPGSDLSMEMILDTFDPGPIYNKYTKPCHRLIHGNYKAR